jgi:serine/threonine protein kinase
MKELNFENEAQNQRTVSSNLARAGIEVIIPNIIKKDGVDLVSSGAMVMEFCEGFKVTDQTQLDKHGVDREALMHRICQAYANQVYCDGFFNADPHPGNILVQIKNGHAIPVLLDFGMTKVLDNTTRLAFAQLIYSTATMDFGGLLRSFDGMGLKLKRDDPMVRSLSSSFCVLLLGSHSFAVVLVAIFFCHHSFLILSSHRFSLGTCGACSARFHRCAGGHARVSVHPAGHSTTQRVERRVCQVQGRTVEEAARAAKIATEPGRFMAA